MPDSISSQDGGFNSAPPLGPPPPPAPTPLPHRPIQPIPPGIQNREWNIRTIEPNPAAAPSREQIATAVAAVEAQNRRLGHPLNPNPTPEQRRRKDCGA